MAELLVNIDVDDLEKAVDFYGRGLGLRVGRRFGSRGVEMVGTSAPIYLLARTSGTSPFSGASSPREYRRHWTPVHLDFVVEDVEAAVRRAESAGARTEGAVGDFEWGRIATMADPFGHGFCMLQFKGRGYDEIATAPA